MRALILLLVSLTACSTGGSGTPGGGVGDYCAAKTARANRCESGVVDPTNCQQELTCYNNALRPELRDEILSCLVNRACKTSDDPCIGTPAQRLASDPDVSAFISACNSKRSACGNNFSDDHCSATYAVVTNDLRAKMRTCLDSACADVGKCFQAAYATVGCD